MPNPVGEPSKIIPVTASWRDQVRYTFPGRDEEQSTDQVDGYRFPISPGTFWVNFRVCRFSLQGDLRMEPIRLRLVVRTAGMEVVEVLPWKWCRPSSWYSTRWALPSLPFVDGVGIWLEIDQESGMCRVEIQGFNRIYPPSNRYILINEEDRHMFLFQQERDVQVAPCTSEKDASIHDLFDEDLPPTHGVSPEEIDGVALFPLGRRL